jgi:hypothetical protein
LRKADSDTFEWLNFLGSFLIEDDNNLIFLDKEPIIPNKNGIFENKKDLYKDGIEDKELIYILKLLGKDWDDILLHENISYIQEHLPSKERRDIALEITECLNIELKKTHENENGLTKKAINILSEWFENNPEQGRSLFPELYRRRAEIFMNTITDKESLYKVMRNCTNLSSLAEVAEAIEGDPTIIGRIQSAKELSDLLKEFNAVDIPDLKNMLNISRNILSDDSSQIKITPETLLSLGITSIKELEEALRDKDISASFIHESTPTVEMFLAVHEKIQRAKDNVIKHLKSLSDYDCSELEELALTVLGGIKKGDLLIDVVVRPSDNGEVIVYYGSEKDILDDSKSELWIDNGKDKPALLTIGKILKKTGISRIPV